MLQIQLDTVDHLYSGLSELRVLVYLQALAQYEIENNILHNQVFDKSRDDVMLYLCEKQVKTVEKLNEIMKCDDFVSRMSPTGK